MKMCDYYYVNQHPNLLGQHEVHAGRYGKLPIIINRNVLGLFDNPQHTATEAKRRGYKKPIVCPCTRLSAHVSAGGAFVDRVSRTISIPIDATITEGAHAVRGVKTHKG